MLKIERTVGENVVFFIYKTRQEKGCRRAGKRSEGTKKEGGVWALVAHTMEQ